MLLSNLLLGLLLSAIISIAAYLRGALAPSGILGAILVGTIIFAAGGLAWAILLIAFFVTSSVLSHYKSRGKEPLAEKFQKGHRRDLGQVLANGGCGALIALAYLISPQPVLFVAFIGAMAAVTADTWATELGVLSVRPPRLITNARVVSVGTSGGVTLFGTLISVCGAVLIGITAAISSYQLPIPKLSIILFSLFSGLLGSLFDSFLGATAQAIYFCDFDQKETESRVHRCGRATRLIRGWRWLDNDGVNFLASVFGSVIAVIGYWVVR